MTITPYCTACKHADVDPGDEPCKACLHDPKGIVASKFEEKGVAE